MKEEPGARKGIFSRMGKREKRAVTAADGISALFERFGGKDRARLNRLWINWESVMGVDIASLSRPLGQTDGVLVVGADDGMAMQELSLLSQEILERANEYMGRNHFCKVTVRLMQGKAGLSQKRETPAPVHPRPLYVPVRVGKHLDDFDPASPITSCYRAHVLAARQGDVD